MKTTTVCFAFALVVWAIFMSACVTARRYDSLHRACGYVYAQNIALLKENNTCISKIITEREAASLRRGADDRKSMENSCNNCSTCFQNNTPADPKCRHCIGCYMLAGDAGLNSMDKLAERAACETDVLLMLEQDKPALTRQEMKDDATLACRDAR